VTAARPVIAFGYSGLTKFTFKRMSLVKSEQWNWSNLRSFSSETSHSSCIYVPKRMNRLRSNLFRNKSTRFRHFSIVIPLLPLFCSYQFRRLDSFQFQPHIPAGWRPETRLFPLHSSFVSQSVILLPTVSRPVYLGIKHTAGAYDQIFIMSDHCCFLIWGALSDERTGLSFAMYNIQYILLSQI
jgi:hypothetical protein